VDRNSATFFATGGLFPQTIGLHFRRPIPLKRVSAFCSGIRTLIYRWRGPGGAWRELTQAMSKGAPSESVTEFVFNVAREGAAATDACRFVINEARGGVRGRSPAVGGELGAEAIARRRRTAPSRSCGTSTSSRSRTRSPCRRGGATPSGTR